MVPHLVIYFIIVTPFMFVCLSCLIVLFSFTKMYKLATIKKRRNKKKIPTPKTEAGKNQTNNQVLRP